MGAQAYFYELQLTLKNEGSKSHFEYDASDRLTVKYEAGVQAKTGDACIRTTLAYRSPTSNQLSGKQEDIYTWDSSWNVA